MEKLEQTRPISKAAKTHGLKGDKIPYGRYKFGRVAVQEVEERKEGTCYLLKLQNDEFRRRVIVCWRDGTVVSIRKKH